MTARGVDSAMSRELEDDGSGSLYISSEDGEITARWSTPAAARRFAEILQSAAELGEQHLNARASRELP